MMKVSPWFRRRRKTALGGFRQVWVEIQHDRPDMTQKDSLKQQMIDDITFLNPRQDQRGPDRQFRSLPRRDAKDSSEAMTYLIHLFVFLFPSSSSSPCRHLSSRSPLLSGGTRLPCISRYRAHSADSDPSGR